MARRGERRGALGATTTVTVTILDDDTTTIVEVPTLGDFGRILLCGLVGLTGFLLLHRKGIGAAAVIMGLLLGGSTAVSAAPAKSPKKRASILTQIQVTGDQTTIRLQDGTTIQVDLDDLEVKDRRRKSRGKRGSGASFQSLAGGQAVVLKVRPGAKNQADRVQVQIFDNLGQAQSAVADGQK